MHGYCLRADGVAILPDGANDMRDMSRHDMCERSGVVRFVRRTEDDSFHSLPRYHAGIEVASMLLAT